MSVLSRQGEQKAEPRQAEPRSSRTLPLARGCIKLAPVSALLFAVTCPSVTISRHRAPQACTVFPLQGTFTPENGTGDGDGRRGAPPAPVPLPCLFITSVN